MTNRGRRAGLILAALLLAVELGAQSQPPSNSAKEHSDATHPQPRVFLYPRFSSGQRFRYEMQFETTTATSQSGLANDPQGPAQLVITWNATIRLDVLSNASNVAGGGIRLRTTYEKSAASIRNDTFDPQAAATQEQYRKLEGKVLEFVLDAKGKVISVSGLEGVVEGEKSLSAAREWITQLTTGSGAPVKGVVVGQKWSSEQPAASLPITGMVWRTQAEYLRNEICRPMNPSLSGAPAGANPAIEGLPGATPSETCAVILTHLDLVMSRPARDPTPDEYLKNGVHTSGTWNGAAQSLSFVSLRTGMAVSVTQSGAEQMDVVFTNERHDAMRYSGRIQSRSEVALLADDSR